MRIVPMALLGLLMATGPALAAKEGGGATRSKAAAAAQQTATTRSSLGVAQDRRAAAATAAQPRRPRWMNGLPPAAGVQVAGCPAGTMATLARGHSDVVRCMPF